MPGRVRGLVVSAAVVIAFGGRSYARQTAVPSISDLLTRYEAGEYEDAAAIAARATDFARFRQELDVAGRQWMLADGANSVERRRAVVATFALEVARQAYEDGRQLALDSPAVGPAGGARGRGTAGPRPNFVRTWAEMRLLIEWACLLMRSAPAPSPSERLWALASLAVATHSPDTLFIAGPPPGTSENRLLEQQRQYGQALGHGRHVQSRLNSDPRLGLIFIEAQYGTRGAAYLISRRLETTPSQFAAKQREAQAILTRARQAPFNSVDASGRQPSFPPSLADNELVALVDLLTNLQKMGQELAALRPSEDTRAEVEFHLGAIALCFADRAAALKYLSDSDRHALTSDDRYLSRFLSGRIHEAEHRVADAEASYRRALEAVPRTHSGVTELASLLFVTGRRSEASALVAEMHASPSPVADPWWQLLWGQAQLTGRDRWPDLIAALRETLK